MSLGVDWFMPKKTGGYMARHFATTTQASSNLIVMLAGDGHTVDSAHAAINFDDDARAVLARFSEAGFGSAPLRDIVA